MNLAQLASSMYDNFEIRGVIPSLHKLYIKKKKKKIIILGKSTYFFKASFSKQNKTRTKFQREIYFPLHHFLFKPWFPVFVFYIGFLCFKKWVSFYFVFKDFKFKIFELWSLNLFTNWFMKIVTSYYLVGKHNKIETK